jgi:hypothetical protein
MTTCLSAKAGTKSIIVNYSKSIGAFLGVFKNDNTHVIGNYIRL